MRERYVFAMRTWFMPIIVNTPTKRLDQVVFGKIAYEVMGYVFDIHREFGRFFDEKIYKQELARRVPNTQLEVPIQVTFESFGKTYFLDVLVEGSAPFEFKTVESLVARHRSQLLSYLLLTDLPHGKLVNMRTEEVQHEFVNTTLRLPDRRSFQVVANDWHEFGERPVRDWFEAFLRDVGTCLDNNLYEEALTHLIGGEEQVLQEVEVVSGKTLLGRQKFRLIMPDVAFKTTEFTEASPGLFVAHARKLLEHTKLQAIQWINIARNEVLFQTIRR
ncbi:MAG: GxxExxY protein [Acidobacteriota bacterium]|nr:GxxExxY protein [Acidobacteriota bacterium]